MPEVQDQKRIWETMSKLKPKARSPLIFGLQLLKTANKAPEPAPTTKLRLPRPIGFHWQCCQHEKHIDLRDLEGVDAVSDSFSFYQVSKANFVQWEDMGMTEVCRWPQCEHRQCDDCEVGFGNIRSVIFDIARHNFETSIP